MASCTVQGKKLKSQELITFDSHKNKSGNLEKALILYNEAQILGRVSGQTDTYLMDCKDL